MNEARLIQNGVVALIDGMGASSAWDATKEINPRLFVDYWSKFSEDIQESCKSDEFHQGLMAKIGVDTPALGLKARLFQDTIMIFSTEDSKYDPRRALVRLADLIMRDTSEWISDPLLPMAFRGVISHGSYWYSDFMVLGDAFLEAKKWYEQPRWLGICTTPTSTGLLDQTAGADREFQERFFLRYDVPLADNKVLPGYALPWPLHVREEDFLRYLNRWPKDPSVQEKVENTKKFFSWAKARARSTEDEPLCSGDT